jgi:uncharacterized protein (TIGR02246 family)
MFDSGIDVAAVDDVAAGRAAIARAHQAWRRGDGRSYAACFTAETRDTTFFGFCRDGRAANADLHGAMFQCAAKGAVLDTRVGAIQWFSPDVALVRTVSHGAAAGYQTYMMVRRDGAWLIRSFQHTPVNALADWAVRKLRAARVTG